MADDPKDKPPLILNPNGRPVRSAGPKIDDANLSVFDRQELQLSELRAEMRAEFGRLHRQDDAQAGAIRIHQEALLELVPIVHGLEQATLAGRIRQLRAWWMRERAALRSLWS